MKNIIISTLAFLAIAGSMLAQAPVVQPNRYGPPSADSVSRVSTMPFYPYEANDAVWQLITVANSGTNIYFVPGQTNNVILTTTVANQTNIVVLPNVTNSVGAVFNILAPGIVRTILSNTVGTTFSSMTNPPNSGLTLPATYELNTNRSIKVFTPTGTNWFVMEQKL